MKTRVVAGLIAAALVILLVMKGPVSLMLLVVLGCASLASSEYDTLFFSERSSSRQIRNLGLVLLSVLTLRAAPETAWVFLWLPLFVLSVIHLRNQSVDISRSIRDLAYELLGIAYLISLFGFLIPIVEANDYGREFLMLLFMIVFSGDTFAYFVGSRWGKRPLASQISPKKSVEGAIASVLGSLSFGGLWLLFVYTGDRPDFFVVRILILVVILSLLAQLGDLFESMLKRSQSRKDSGWFLPGHGGILDRLDGLSFSAPAFYFFIRYLLEHS